MKRNNLKKTFIFIILFVSATSFIFADSIYERTEKATNERDNIVINYPKIRKPESKNVAVIGRIVVNTTEDMDFYVKTRNVPASKITGEDLYAISGFEGVYKSTDFFYVEKERPRKNSKDDMSLFLNFNYRIMGTNRLALSYPLHFSFDVPDDCRYVYIGTIVVTTIGDDFTVKQIDVVDEYEEAQKFLESSIKSRKTPVLYRVNLE